MSMDSPCTVAELMNVLALLPRNATIKHIPELDKELARIRQHLTRSLSSALGDTAESHDE